MPPSLTTEDGRCTCLFGTRQTASVWRNWSGSSATSSNGTAAARGRQALQIVRMLGRSRRWCWTGPGGHRSLAASLPRAGADQVPSVPTRPCARIDQNPDQRSLRRSGQTVACLTVGQQIRHGLLGQVTQDQAPAFRDDHSYVEMVVVFATGVAQPAESSSPPITLGTLKNSPSVSGAFCRTFSSGSPG